MALPPDPLSVIRVLLYLKTNFRSRVLSRAWHRIEWNGMGRKFRCGIWKMPELNGMEDFKNGMEDNLPYFHSNSMLDFAHGIYRKIYGDSDN